jgi:hypothetical protein
MTVLKRGRYAEAALLAKRFGARVFLLSVVKDAWAT